MAITNYCECDNTHEANNTVCQFCYEQKNGEKMKPEIDKYKLAEMIVDGYDHETLVQSAIEEVYEYLNKCTVKELEIEANRNGYFDFEESTKCNCRGLQHREDCPNHVIPY